MIDEENIFNDSSQNKLLLERVGSVGSRNSIRIPQKQQIEIQDGDSSLSSKKIRLELDKPIERELIVSLEDILRGTTKHEKITRNVLDSNGSVKQEDKNFNVKVKAGMAIGSRITFPGEGNQSKGYAQGDVVFIVKDEPNARFKLINQVDIEYTAKITVEESKTGCELAIPTLENDPILLTIEEEITEDMVEKISGRGLFYANEPKKRGYLIIRFEICEHMPEERLTAEDDDHIDELDNESSNKENQSKLSQNNSQQNFKQNEPSKGPKGPSLPQDPPVEHDLKLTLEQILKGCKKKLMITRIVLEPDGESETFEDKVVRIEVKPGTEEGTRYTFPREGDHNPGTIPADVVFIVRDKPHDVFKRYGPHIEYTASITQKQFLNGMKIRIPTLEKEDLEFSLGELSKPSAVKRFYHRGLPFANDANKRGDLIVRFEVNKNADSDEESEFPFSIPETFQDPPIENDLFITLEQILKGCTKKLKIDKLIVDSNGNERIEDKILKINVEPGTEFGTKVTFPRESDQRPGIIPADIIFTIKEKPHEVFKRNGLDIEYTVQVYEKNCKDGTKIQIPTLGKDEKITLTLTEAIVKDNIVKIKNQGLPHKNDFSKRGELIVRLNVIKDTSMDKSTAIARKNVNESKQVASQQPGQTKQLKSQNQSKITETISPQNQDEIQRGKASDDKDVLEMQKPLVKNVEKQPEIAKSMQTQNRQNVQTEQKTNLVEKEKPKQEAQRGGRIPIWQNPNQDVKSKLTQIQQTQQESPVTQTKEKPENQKVKDGTQIQLLPQKPQMQEISQSKQNKILQNEQPITNQVNPTQVIQTQPKLVESPQPLLIEPSQPKLVAPPPPKLPKDPTIELPLELTLKDIMFGCEIDYKSKTNDKEIIFPIKVEPGTLPGTIYTFSNASHQYPGRIPADVVFIVRVLEHPCFKIEESTLFYTALITQSESQNGVQLEIPTPDGELMKKTFSGPIRNGSVKAYRNRGLPDSNNPQERGSLVVQFEIVGDQFKDPPIEERIELSLESILSGCKKEIKYNRNYFDLEGMEQVTEKSIAIDIKSGAETGLICYTRKGIYNPGRIPADIEIAVCEAKHPYFTRRGNDIEYIAKILQDDLQRKKVAIPTLDKHKIDLPIGNETVKNPIQRIPAFGFPDASGKRGDLVVHFEIVGGPVNDNAIKATQKSQDVPDEIEYNLAITLEEIIHGNIKYVAVRDEYGNDTGKKNKIIIRPGSVAGMNMLYETKGMQKFAIIIEEKEHKIFTRIGLDIHYKAQISLKEALCGGKVQIPKLGKMTTNIPLVKVVNPDKPTIIPNRGIPDINNPKKRGNMVVSWKVQFPNKLSKEDKIELSQIFHRTFERYLSYRDKIKILNKVSAKQIQPKNKSNNSSSNKNPYVEHEVSMSLEDILQGSSKCYQIPRIVIDSNGGKRTDSKVLNVTLNPGQIKAIFPKEGNHIPGSTPSDIVFTVIDAPHPVFKRVKQADIQCTALITLQEALCGFKLRVPSLEKTPEKVELMFGLDDDSAISHKEKYKIAGLGLPYPDNPNSRGDLIVQFEIIFPDELSKEQKTKIGRILNV